jgi:hypothetical protein
MPCPPPLPTPNFPAGTTLPSENGKNHPQMPNDWKPPQAWIDQQRSGLPPLTNPPKPPTMPTKPIIQNTTTPTTTPTTDNKYLYIAGALIIAFCIFNKK